MTIARIRSDFPAKFGIPRQAGLVPELRAQVVFEPAFRNPDAVRGLDGFSRSSFEDVMTVDRATLPKVDPHLR